MVQRGGGVRLFNGPINLDSVERVEVVVGPSSFFQRANTLAATINVITRDVQGAEVVDAAGSDVPYSFTAMIGHRWADDDIWSMSVTTEKITGFDAWRAPFRTAIAGRDLTGELDEPNFFGVLKRQYHEWTFQGVAYQTSMPELNIDSGDPRNNGELQDKLFSLYAKREHPYGDDLTGIFIADSTFKQQTRLNQDGPPIPGSTKEKCLTQMEYSGELALKYTGVDRHVIQVGSQFDYFDAFNCFWNYVQLSPYEVWNHAPLIQGDMNEVGVYLDDEFQVNDRLKLIGGVRQDHDSALPGNGWYTGIRSAIVLRLPKIGLPRRCSIGRCDFPRCKGL